MRHVGAPGSSSTTYRVWVRDVAGAGFLFAGLGAVSVGVRLLWNGNTGVASSLIFAGALLIVLADWRGPEVLTDQVDGISAVVVRDLRGYRVSLLACAAGLGVFISAGIQTGWWGLSDRTLAQEWVLAMVCLVAAVFPPIDRRLFARMTRTGLAVAGVLFLATLMRIIPAGADYPVYGDEGYHVLLAQAIMHSPRPDLFTLDYLDLARMYYAGWGLLLQIVGTGVAAARLFSAWWGVAGVGATYLLSRELFGSRVALLAGIVLAVDPLDVRYSRFAMGNEFAPALMPLALFFLVRGLNTGQQRWWMAAGIAAGIAQYGHTDARFLVLMVALLLLYEAVRSPSALWAQRWNVGLMVLCAVLAYVPTLSNVIHHPALWTGRSRALNIFQSGWLAQQQQTQGLGNVLASQVSANVLPLFTVATPADLFYPDGAMFVPWAIPFTVAGILASCVRAWQRPHFLLLTWLLLVFVLAGVFVTPNFASQHLVSLSVPLSIFAALGIEWVAREWPFRGGRGVVLILTTCIAASGVSYYFIQYAPVPARNNSQEYKDSVATEVGQFLHGFHSDTRVYFYCQQYLTFHGEAQAHWLSGRDDVVDVLPGSPQPRLRRGPGGTIFLFLPSRLDQLKRVEMRFPGGRVIRLSNSYVHGATLVTAYVLRGPASTRSSS